MIKIKEIQNHESGTLQNGAVQHRRIIQSPAGPLVLQQHCSPSLIAELRVDQGLHAFARSPEREYALLFRLAQRPDCALTLAYTPSGEIVGQVTIAPCDIWGQVPVPPCEIAFEVSTSWRRLGLAHQLLSLALELDTLEDLILLGIGLCWHWDTEGMNLTAFGYRRLIAQLCAPHGFVEYPTTNPDICMHPANILLTRIGSRIDQQTVGQLMNRLLGEPLL